MNNPTWPSYTMASYFLYVKDKKDLGNAGFLVSAVVGSDFELQTSMTQSRGISTNCGLGGFGFRVSAGGGGGWLGLGS